MAQWYIEDRKKHWDGVIEPILKKGVHVICDRFTLSTLPYQSTQGIQLETLRDMHTIRGIGSPEVTFYLDIPVSIAQERMKRRGDAPEKFDELEFQKKLSEKYKELIRISKIDNCLRDLIRRVDIINANQPIEELARNIIRIYDADIG